MTQTILQHPILTKFVYPFLLMFFIVFAILEKTKVLGDKKQINALVAFVIGLIFVAAAYPKMVVGNMVLFLTIALVVVFVGLMLWGLIAGEEGLKFSSAPQGLKWTIGIIILIGLILAVLWATGVGLGFFENIIGENTKEFWTNLVFIVMVAVALAVILGVKNKSR
jgi:hypothetical protein